MESDSTSVLVVGGGLAGLSAALFLSWRGVPTTLIERHTGSSPHPRARGFTPRTLELLRAVGLGERVPQRPAADRRRPRRARVESLTGQWFEESEWTPGSSPDSPPAIEHSPCGGTALAQDRLEPILREKAIELGADVRLGTELRSWEQDEKGVRATVRSRDGAERTLSACYLVAADGSRSPVREELGIPCSGRGHLRTVRSVLFRAPLKKYVRARVAQFVIDQPELQAFLTTYGDDRWMLVFSDDRERDDAALRSAILLAVGSTDPDGELAGELELLTTGRWDVAALVAEHFAHGRVFLAGDAAHTLPPNRGGYGANTGIEDAHNLAWKLSAVLTGVSDRRLLDTYDAERRPIARLRHDQIFVRTDHSDQAPPERADRDGRDELADGPPILDDDAVEFGALYRSRSVLGADGELPAAARPEQWAGQPGTRAPHLWLTRQGERLSTLDLFQHGWVLLGEDEAWAEAAERAAGRTGVPVECRRIGEYAEVQGGSEEFRRAYGLSPEGAALVRPDGYIGWRSPGLPEDPAAALTEALGRVAASPRPSVHDYSVTE